MPPQQVRITPDNRGPLVNLANWITLVVVCLATLTKIATKLQKTGRPQGDDFIMFAAMLAAAAQSIAVAKQVQAGLGQHINTLTANQVESYQKTGYVAQLLYVLALCLPKFAVLQFLSTIAITKPSRITQKAIVAVNFVWAFVAVIIIASQCASSKPWAILSDKCSDQPALWDFIGTADIAVNVAIIALPIWVLYDLRVTRAKKLTIMSAFALRALLIPLAVLRLVYIKSASRSRDQTFDDVQTTLLTQVDMNMSIIFACFIFLKPFMDGLQTGLLASDIQILSSKKSSRNGTFGLGTWSRKNRKDEMDLGIHERLDTQESIKQVVVKTSEITGNGHESMRTGDGSAKDTIKKTTDIVQHFEPRELK
ncbi:hypothetical protein MMC07_001141 [Pseudocyphellaria aurata]|nr:hypothetical protein [Pseudocyphellaria aurata]